MDVYWRRNDGQVERFPKKLFYSRNNLPFLFTVFLFPVVYSVLHLKQADTSGRSAMFIACRFVKRFLAHPSATVLVTIDERDHA